MNPSLPDFLHALYYRIFRVTLRVHQPVNLPLNPPDFLATIRGALNAALTSGHCRQPNPTGRPCEGCDCLYFHINGERWSGENEQAGRFQAPAKLIYWMAGKRNPAQPGDTVQYYFTLFGQANDFIPDLCRTLDSMASKFIGAPGSLELEEVMELDENRKPKQAWMNRGGIYSTAEKPPITLADFQEHTSPETQISLYFDPMVIILQKKKVPMAPPLDLLVERLLGRLALIATASCGVPWEPSDAAAHTLSRGVQVVAYDYRPATWVKRDSGRTLRPGQNRKNRPFNGITGGLTLQGPGLKYLLPVLRFGQYVHIGKQTAFGLGHYVLSTEEETVG